MKLREKMINEWEHYFNKKGVLINREELFKLVNNYLISKNLDGENEDYLPIFNIFINFIFYILDFYTLKSKSKDLNISKKILKELENLKKELEYFKNELENKHANNFFINLEKFKQLKKEKENFKKFLDM